MDIHAITLYRIRSFRMHRATAAHMATEQIDAISVPLSIVMYRKGNMFLDVLRITSSPLSELSYDPLKTKITGTVIRPGVIF